MPGPIGLSVDQLTDQDHVGVPSEVFGAGDDIIPTPRNGCEATLSTFFLSGNCMFVALRKE